MEITQNQIEQWKEQHGGVFKVVVEDKVAYLKTPSRKVLGYASSLISKDPIKFNEIILNDCFLGGDEEIKTNDAYFLAASSKLSEIIEVKEAELVKL